MRVFFKLRLLLLVSYYFTILESKSHDKKTHAQKKSYRTEKMTAQNLM